MRLYVAPMEGVTGRVFRQVHHRHFPGADRYYMPFLSPGQEHHFTRRDLREILPGEDREIPAVPQLLTRRAEDFLWAAGELAAMGYRQVDLNLGCPSGTVTAKGKGAGFLARPEELDAFLEEVFSKAPLAVSVKTRLGMKDPEEFPRLLEIFDKYPIVELTIHPRVRTDFYKGAPRQTWFQWALDHSGLPLCYNGDLVGAQAVREAEAAWPAASALMVGRGIVADPSLFRRARGGPPLGREELRAYLDDLYESYAGAFQSRRNAMIRMKELWYYLMGLFEDDGKGAKGIRKARDTGEYEAQVERIFRTFSLRQEARPVWNE